MPQFLIAAGGVHGTLFEKMSEVPPSAGFNPAKAVKRGETAAWTVIEWKSERDEYDADLAVFRETSCGLDCFLFGYLTEPEPLDRQTMAGGNAHLNPPGELFAEAVIGNPELLNGSFALVSIGADGSIRILSDRFASRTIWRTYHRGTWLLASHPVLLWLATGKGGAVNPAALGSLLLRARPSGEGCLLQTGSRNLSGHRHELLPDGRESRKRWFHPRYHPCHGLSAAEWGDRLASVLVANSARLKGVMEKPLLFLSGGLDSRLALAALLTSFSPQCVTLLDRENLESNTARAVARAAGAFHHTIARDREWYLRVMESSSLLQWGGYHPSHSHFSPGLRKIGSALDYDAAMLGDFLEAFQKLMGDHTECLGAQAGPAELCEQVLTLDGRYAAWEKSDALRYLREDLRKEVHEAWRADLCAGATEAFEVSDELPVVVDYFLRWRSAYELASYGMIEDVRSYAPERSLSMDTELHDLLLRIPARERGHGRIAVEAIRRLCPQLAGIRNSNTLLPASAPQCCHRAVKWLRPRLGSAKQQLKHRFGITDATMASSWTDRRLLATTDPHWIDFIDAVLTDPSALPGTIFDRKSIDEAWSRYRAGELRLGFSIDSLVTFGMVHRRFGSGKLM